MKTCAEITEFLLFQKSKQKTLLSLLDWRKRQHTNGQAKISYTRGLPHKKSIINLPDSSSKHSTSSTAYFIFASLSFLFFPHLFPTERKTVKGTLPQISSSWSLYSHILFFPLTNWVIFEYSGLHRDDTKAEGCVPGEPFWLKDTCHSYFLSHISSKFLSSLESLAEFVVL